MICLEDSMLLRHLAGQGEPKQKIAERVGVCRQTVYNHIHQENLERKPRKARASKLDPYKSYIDGQLEEYDLPATVLLKRVKERGYTGSITILRDYVRQVKAEKVRDVTRRFETSPGHQAQVDWGECGHIVVDGVRKKLYVLVVVLGFSRMMFARFTTSMRQPVLLQCLREAFGELGIPSELLVDNMKTAVDLHTADGVRFNRTFLDFCDHHGVMPKAAPPYWARAKGKVERGVAYIKHSFLEGLTFCDLADLNAQLQVWLDGTANVRVHGTTGERPIDRYTREQPHMRPLAAVPVYDTRSEELRQVMRDSHVRYQGVSYSVDPMAVGKTVRIRPSGECIGDVLEVYLGNQCVGRHELAPRYRGRVTHSEHERMIRQAAKKPTRQRPRRQPQFVQRTSDASLPVAPVVQERPLGEYEAFCSGGGA